MMNVTNPELCLPSADNAFGPIVSSTCRQGFDFTLTFEHLFFSIVPSVLLLIFAPLRLWVLHGKKQGVIAARRRWRDVKMLITFIFAVLQLALLVLWSEQSKFENGVSTVAAALSLVDVVFICLLSYAEHSKSIRPSTLLSVYLVLSLLFDIARARTLWLLSSRLNAIAVVFTASVAVKLLMLILEAREKRKWLKGDGTAKQIGEEELSGIFSQGFLWWLNKLIILGSKRVLGIEDLYPLDIYLESDYLATRFEKTWRKSAKSTGRYKLLLALLRALKWDLVFPVLPRLVLIAFTFCQPLLLNRFIIYLQHSNPNDNANTGIGLVGAYFFTYLGIAISTSFYWHRVNRALTMTRGYLVSAIYRKTTEISITALDNSAAITLMSTDTQRVTNGLQQFHELWANIIQVGIATFLLERELGLACLAPVLIAAASVAATFSVAKPSMKHQRVWMKNIQKRIGVTSAAISSMKGMKMAGLEDRLQTIIQGLRAYELDSASQYRSIVNYTAVIAFIPQLLSPAITFAVFVAATHLTGSTLDTVRMFTSLSLLTLLSRPLAVTFGGIPQLLGSLSCCDRIQTFLLSDTKSDHRILIESSCGTQQPEASSTALIQSNSMELAQTQRKSEVIIVREGFFGWKLSETPILSDVNFSIQQSQLTMVVGPVASGKSTLLKALLGEVPNFSGSVYISTTEVAFCDQTPWLINDTIQNNILGFSNFDEAFYSQVIHACELEEDFSVLPLGDKSLIGSKGITLSGGQKQRIAIARAVYSRKSIVIFDDIFSGLDAATEDLVFGRLLGPQGLLRQQDISVIIATHAVNLLPSADHIIVLGQHGYIVEQGSFQQLNTNNGYVQSLLVKQSKDKALVAVSQAVKHTLGLKQTTIDAAPDKKRQMGDMAIYKYYLQKIGAFNTFLCFLFAFMFVFFSTFPSIWLKWWSDANEIDPGQMAGYYLGVYAAFQVMSLISIFLLGWHCLTTVIAKSGLDLHLVILRTMMAASMSFFSSVDTGVTVNRFSQDMQIIDGELPFGLMRVIASLFSVMAQGILIAISSGFIAITYPFVSVIFFYIQQFYLRTSRQLRFMDLEAKSPLYTQFIESLAGLATLRAFNWQEASRNLNLELLDISQKPFYLLKMIQQWLTLILNLVSMGLALVVVGLAVRLRDEVSPGLAGVALVNLISFADTLQELVSFWTMLETSIGAISRIQSFSQLSPESLPEETNQPPENWPERGEIEFQNVSAAYNPTDKDAISDLSLTIRPGEKFGICGRSGSGKSTVLLSLFRLLDYHTGNITIDSLSLSTLPRSIIRSRLISIPQEPFFLAGTLRLNIDPYEQSTDEAIVEALTKVGLDDLDLDINFEEGMLSHGQRQLFCLARAMLRKGSVVVLDEATSSVDRKTDAIMQRLIREEFKGRTIIAIAHRLQTLLDFDHIAVLDGGKLAECGSPEELLAREGGLFRGLVEKGEVEEDSTLER